MKNKKENTAQMNNSAFERFSKEITPEESAEVEGLIKAILAQSKKKGRAKTPSKKR